MSTEEMQARRRARVELAVSILLVAVVWGVVDVVGAPDRVGDAILQVGGPVALILAPARALKSQKDRTSDEQKRAAALHAKFGRDPLLIAALFSGAVLLLMNLVGFYAGLISTFTATILDPQIHYQDFLGLVINVSLVAFAPVLFPIVWWLAKSAAFRIHKNAAWWLLGAVLFALFVDAFLTEVLTTETFALGFRVIASALLFLFFGMAVLVGARSAARHRTEYAINRYVRLLHVDDQRDTLELLADSVEREVR